MAVHGAERSNTPMQSLTVDPDIMGEKEAQLLAQMVGVDSSESEAGQCRFHPPIETASSSARAGASTPTRNHPTDPFYSIDNLTVAFKAQSTF
ncbi:hypothetical protein Pyn_11019 [Prunus yedoensis var. nudiflora]|uniref:Uncharacterized protein n=1 Tax=Prunus yedoensis var. nudiflora TaxID=2094558 RepID=A0A314Z2A6_PRUYE|nr:hypothetical protein Pyn_11019 [Prunus yedoensis var. nudiflora]